MSGTKSGASTKKRNHGQFKPGKSGNPKGKRALTGQVEQEIVDLARSSACEAFAIVQEIARHGENEGERLRAARLWLEIGAKPDEEEKSDEDYRIKWQDTDYRVPRG